MLALQLRPKFWQNEPNAGDSSRMANDLAIRRALEAWTARFNLPVPRNAIGEAPPDAGDGQKKAPDAPGPDAGNNGNVAYGPRRCARTHSNCECLAACSGGAQDAEPSGCASYSNETSPCNLCIHSTGPSIGWRLSAAVIGKHITLWPRVV
jgi:hypothetical protein